MCREGDKILIKGECDMSNGFRETIPIYANRIGPIMDPKFLNMIPVEKVKDIIIVQLKAQIHAMQEEIKAIEEVVNIVNKTKLG